MEFLEKDFKAPVISVLLEVKGNTLEMNGSPLKNRNHVKE